MEPSRDPLLGACGCFLQGSPPRTPEPPSPGQLRSRGSDSGSSLSSAEVADPAADRMEENPPINLDDYVYEYDADHIPGVETGVPCSRLLGALPACIAAGQAGRKSARNPQRPGRPAQVAPRGSRADAVFPLQATMSSTSMPSTGRTAR